MFRFSIASLAVACFVSSFAFAAEEKVELNKEESKIEFVGKKSDGQHTGGFKEFTADAKVNHDEPTKGSIKIEIKTDSLFSDDPRLTAHLKNPDFFDVKKYPTITFQSKSIEMDGEDKAKITGILTMLGKEEEVVVPVTVTGDEEEFKLIAKFEIDRTKWGMEYGEGKVNNEVGITATLVFDR